MGWIGLVISIICLDIFSCLGIVIVVGILSFKLDYLFKLCYVGVGTVEYGYFKDIVDESVVLL